MKLLTKEHQESYENAKIYICEEKPENKYLKNKKYHKVRDHFYYTGGHRGAAHSICNSKCSVPKKISTVFHNVSKYNYHFIIKKLAEEFKKQFTCLGGNTKKCRIFTVSIEKEVARIEKNREEITKNIHYILQFIDSARFMATSLSNLANNLSKGIHKIKCKYRHDHKKCETCRNKYKYCNYFLEYMNFKNNLIEYKCLCVTIIINKSLIKSLKNYFLIPRNFVPMTKITSFYCFKKLLILMNIWMIGKNSMKHHYLSTSHQIT